MTPRAACGCSASAACRSRLALSWLARGAHAPRARSHRWPRPWPTRTRELAQRLARVARRARRAVDRRAGAGGGRLAAPGDPAARERADRPDARRSSTPSSRTSSRTCGATTSPSTCCRRPPRSCSSTTRPAGGSRAASAPSASTCCDDIAVSLCGDRLVYATALADLEALRGNAALALAATDGPLLQRVRRLLSPSPAARAPVRHGSPPPCRSALVVAVMASATLTGTAASPDAAAQNQPPAPGQTIPAGQRRRPRPDRGRPVGPAGRRRQLRDHRTDGLGARDARTTTAASRRGRSRPAPTRCRCAPRAT